MFFLRGLPSAENLIDREQLDVRDLRVIFRRRRGKTRAEIMLGRDLLSLAGIEIFEVGLRDLARAALVDG
jgi:hypothetical protein